MGYCSSRIARRAYLEDHRSTRTGGVPTQQGAQHCSGHAWSGDVQPVKADNSERRRPACRCTDVLDGRHPGQSPGCSQTLI
ncbi:hypothetical protein CesoFtcFv8_020830 [Champsocephalus esox]|uniref:Uncharacterized protein n=1 Tax=Champsocephalus esox TaxID=159716 RepID=A0AAN8BBL3_9TELE|nr:hypothetical protein CesoFtcFv8_020830 [Champsocephalus esox]